MVAAGRAMGADDGVRIVASRAWGKRITGRGARLPAATLILSGTTNACTTTRAGRLGSPAAAGVDICKNKFWARFPAACPGADTFCLCSNVS